MTRYYSPALFSIFLSSSNFLIISLLPPLHQNELSLCTGQVFFVAAGTNVTIFGGDKGIEIYRAFCE